MNDLPIDHNVLYAPPDQGTGANIPSRYNPLKLVEKITDDHSQQLFLISAIAAYEFLGYDTPSARRKIEEAFLEFHCLQKSFD